jgi:hypothetical protein
VICKSINIITKRFGKREEFLTKKLKTLKMSISLFMIILIPIKFQKKLGMVTKILKQREVTLKLLGKLKKKNLKRNIKQ